MAVLWVVLVLAMMRVWRVLAMMKELLVVFLLVLWRLAVVVVVAACRRPQRPRRD